jgi:deferrochelatase/peroxidase EfeB
MGGAALNRMPGSVERDDIQGLAAFSYGKLTAARYILGRIRNAAAARAWCRTAPLSNARSLPSAPATAMQIAFTVEGLRALGVPERVIGGFSTEFVEGMSGATNRSRRLGDVGASDPALWSWGGPEAVPHIAVLLYAKKSPLDAWQNSLLGSSWQEGFEVVRYLETSNMGDKEPFGFRDGISQPTVDWDRRRDPSGASPAYTNMVSLGEFVLGYPNEYGKYTDRPLLRPADDPGNELAAAEDVPDARDLGRNGTYVVLRQLEQDVRGLWQFVDRISNGDAQRRYELAARMVGRSQEGDPLIEGQPARIPGVDNKPGQPRNSFVYDSDSTGVQCPFGAHIRRANPRNADLPDNPGGPIAKLFKSVGVPREPYGPDLIASVRFHRILRRGREYGEKISPEDAVRPGLPDEAPRGLHFACIAANISRQFEFVQGAWLISPKFDGMADESDPLLGNRERFGGCAVTDAFSIPRANGAATRIGGLPQFIVVRGGAYFFMPGLRALRWITGGKYGDS